MIAETAAGAIFLEPHLAAAAADRRRRGARRAAARRDGRARRVRRDDRRSAPRVRDRGAVPRPDARHDAGPTRRSPRCAPDARTAVVTLTHDPKLDDPALIAALASPAFYVGCLGSQKTHAAPRARLGERGIDAGIARSPARPGRAADRRAHAAGDRGLDPRRDHRDAARSADEVRADRGRARRSGAILAHTTRAGDRVLKKGRVLSAGDAAALAAAGHRDDHRRAARSGRARRGRRGRRRSPRRSPAPGLAVDAAHTGRANLRAAAGGLVELDRAAIAAANADRRGDHRRDRRAVRRRARGRHGRDRQDHPVRGARPAPWPRRAAAARGAVALRPWRGCRGGLVLTRFADTAARVLDRAAAAQRTRLERCGATLAAEVRVRARRRRRRGRARAARRRRARSDPRPRRVGDRRPARRHPGRARARRRRDRPVRHAGRSGQPAAPRRGCAARPCSACRAARARSSARASTRCSSACARACRSSGADLAAMGVGGLLDEISVRARRRASRAGPTREPDERARVAAIVLAAGRASRMGSNKLIAELDGEPIVRRTVAAALGVAGPAGRRGHRPRGRRRARRARRPRRRVRAQPELRRAACRPRCAPASRRPARSTPR